MNASSIDQHEPLQKFQEASYHAPAYVPLLQRARSSPATPSTRDSSPNLEKSDVQILDVLGKNSGKDYGAQDVLDNSSGQGSDEHTSQQLKDEHTIQQLDNQLYHNQVMNLLIASDRINEDALENVRGDYDNSWDFENVYELISEDDKSNNTFDKIETEMLAEVNKWLVKHNEVIDFYYKGNKPTFCTKSKCLKFYLDTQDAARKDCVAHQLLSKLGALKKPQRQIVPQATCEKSEGISHQMYMIVDRVITKPKSGQADENQQKIWDAAGQSLNDAVDEIQSIVEEHGLRFWDLQSGDNAGKTLIKDEYVIVVFDWSSLNLDGQKLNPDQASKKLENIARGLKE